MITVKGLTEQPGRKVEGVGVDKRLVFLLCLWGLIHGTGKAQDLPQDEIQVNVSGYFDSFDVAVIYPNVSLTKRVTETTSLTGHYLVDMVTAASIGNLMAEPDAVTSASGRGRGGSSFDDVRHEASLGFTQRIAGRLLSLNGIYSQENDYASTTIASTFTQSFARQNTTLQLGLVQSWDKVSPVTKDWTRDKRVTTLSASLSQILSKRLIAQLLYSYMLNTGHLSDDYKLVTIAGEPFDPIHPDRRVRQAASLRFNYRLNEKSALQVGYRYYWDTWSVNSHTVSGLYQRHLSRALTLGIGLRSYVQSKASFFKPVYTEPEPFITVDNKLDAGYSNELQLKLTINGGKGRRIPFLNSEQMQYLLGLNIYRRHTDTPDWYSHRQTLWASYFNVGLRYRF